MYIYMSHFYINVYSNMYINKIKKLRKREADQFGFSEYIVLLSKERYVF